MMEEDSPSEVCLYCFGAKELTTNGKLFTPCPICKGGKLINNELVMANKKWLQQLNELSNLNNEE